MARYFVTGFFPQGDGEVGITGFVTDRALGVYTIMQLDNVRFDPTISTSAREQIQNQIVSLANAALINIGITNLTLVASDVEYIS